MDESHRGVSNREDIGKNYELTVAGGSEKRAISTTCGETGIRETSDSEDNITSDQKDGLSGRDQTEVKFFLQYTDEGWLLIGVCFSLTSDLKLNRPWGESSTVIRARLPAFCWSGLQFTPIVASLLSCKRLNICLDSTLATGLEGGGVDGLRKVLFHYSDMLCKSSGGGGGMIIVGVEARM